MHYTEYSNVLNYFKEQVNEMPNTDLKNILYEFARLKDLPNDIGAARYLISQFPVYLGILQQANTHVQ